MERAVRKQDRIIGTLSMEFTVSDGNELFQDFLMGRRSYPLPQLLHEEDRERFITGVQQAAEGGFETAARVREIQGEYRWYYLYIKKFQAECGSEFYRLEMLDIFRMETGLDRMQRMAEQYERFLGMHNHMYFVYDYETERMQIFWMNDNQRHVVVDRNLKDWEAAESGKEYFREEEEKVFHMLCSDIEKGTERFVHDICSKMFATDDMEQLYQFRGITWKYKDRRKECYGTIQLLDKRTKRIKLDSTLGEQLDPLTGLYNKRICMQKLRSLINEKNDDTALTICMLDLDNFKTLNDTYGHLFGDRVLVVVADTMREVLGNRGVAGRFGGDEFFMIIDSDINEQEIRQILFTIRKNVRWYFERSEDRIVVTLSVGTASFPKDATDMDELFAKADRALYIAKEKGKDRYIIYDEEKHGRVTFDSEHRKIVELSLQNRKEDNMTSAVMYVYDALEKKGAAAMEEVLGFIGKVFAIDRINIFRNPDLMLWQTWGYETWHQDNAAYILWEGYLKNFNGHKVDVCCGLDIRAYKYPKVYEYLSKLEIKSSLQYIVGEGAEMTGLISYEMCKVRRKWSDEDVHNLTLISRFIEAVLS